MDTSIWKQGPELGSAVHTLFRVCREPRQGDPGRLGMDGRKSGIPTATPPEMRRADAGRAPALRKTPPLKPGGSLQAQGRGVWSWGLYFFVLLCFVLL